MRLSGDKNDSNYHPIAPYATVYVDGIQENSVISLDTKTGSYKVYPTPLHIDENGDVVYETRYGNIVLDLSLAPEDLLYDFLNKQGEDG